MDDPETILESEPQGLEAPAPAAPARRHARQEEMARVFLGTAALVCLATAALTAATPTPTDPGHAFAIAFAALALTAVGAMRAPGRWLAAALTAQMSALMAAIGAAAAGLGWGLATPPLYLAGLVVCLLCVTVSGRAGAWLALLSVLAVVAAAWGTPAPALPGALLPLGTHLLAIACGLAAGILIWRAMSRYGLSAQQRQERFRSLLGLATDAYWEIDQLFRLVAVVDARRANRPLAAAQVLGELPWDLPNFSCDAETLDTLQADLGSWVPFRDVPIRWHDEGSGVRSLLISGEPRFDARGVFTGYWGVARDITDILAAEEALAATETRYQELFARIPTPLLLHRGGRVIDANPAAVALFGHTNLPSLLGSDLLAAYESGDSRDRARRRQEMLQGQPLGTALPVADFRLLVQGRQVWVRAAGVCVQAEGGAAVLSIFVDDTVRLAAEEAVRRSEALLSHLVATSPDLITLTDLASGRYAMVNRSFEQLSGWTAAEAVGASPLDLGIWPQAAVGEAFLARVRQSGSVSDLPTQFVNKSGEVFSMIVSAALFVMERREYMVINARDVTEKERARLEREAILANASIGIAVTRQQQIVLANRHLEQIFGWGPGELVGQPLAAAWSDGADFAEVTALVAPTLLRGEPVELERPARRRDGSAFVVRLRGQAIDPQRPVESGTAWIVEDVTERRESQQALARARDDAEAANRAKSAFLANTSHELRTPLNGIIGLAHLAREEAVPEKQRRQYLDQIADSAQSLAGIISDILDLSKIEAGKLALESVVFDLTGELQALHRSYAAVAENRHLELHLELAPDLGHAARGDPLRVRQVVSNFISNALKFTARGWVSVRAHRRLAPHGDVVRFEVQDTGPGINMATRDRLFKPFTQADESTTRRFGGTGLGLSICRELATLMGGGVGVDSPPGRGCTFWAELPLPPARAPQDRPAPQRAAALLDMRVLIAEDNPVNMLIAVALLQRWGVEVTQAEDGSQAVAEVQRAAAEGRAFDAVLMDVQMPVMGGHEATRALRQTEAGRTLPIIALTAAALVTEREEALAAGMNDFLTKPIDADKLYGALARYARPGPGNSAAAEPIQSTAGCK